MSRTSRLAAVFHGEYRSTTGLAFFPALSIAILFVSSVPITALTVAVAITFPIAVTITVPSLSLPLRVSLALSAVLPVAFTVPMAIPTALAAFTFRAVTAVLASLRGIRVLATTAFALEETPIVHTVHVPAAAVHESFAARPALRARVPRARPRRWRL